MRYESQVNRGINSGSENSYPLTVSVRIDTRSGCQQNLMNISPPAFSEPFKQGSKAPFDSVSVNSYPREMRIHRPPRIHY